MKGKSVLDSAVSDHTHLLFPNDLNSNDTVFGGRVLEIADRLAVTVAQRHSGLMCVTASIDAVQFHGPARKGEALIFKLAANRVFKTSMEIGVNVMAENLKTGERRHVVSAYFTFVAVDENWEPIPIRPVIPETPDEKRRFKEAEKRKKNRIKYFRLFSRK